MANRSDDEHLRVSPPTSSGSDASWVVYNPSASASSDAAAVPVPAPPQQPSAPAQQPPFTSSPRADPTPFSAAAAQDTASPPSRSVYIPLDQSVASSTAAWPFQGEPPAARPYSTPESSSTAPFGIPWQSPALGSHGVAQSYAPGSSRIPSGGSIIDKKASPHPDGTPDLGTPTMHYPRPFYRPQTDAAPPSLSQSIGSWSRDRRKVDEPSPWDTPGAWLVYYFAFNLGLTLFNKGVLQGFPFAWTLTAVHTACGTLGTFLAKEWGYFTPSRLSQKEMGTLGAFSVLYTINIAVSNLSLNLVTVPFHQVVRATTPLFTIALTIVWFKRSYPLHTYLALLLVVFGVGLSTYGDYGWTSWGLFLTFLGTLLAALKTVTTNLILVGRLKLHPLDLLMRMSVLACAQCVVYAIVSGEAARVFAYAATDMTRGKTVALLINGVLAFGLNVVSFTANKRTSALTMTVAANVKQVLTIVLSVFIFNLHITATNALGILVTILGGVAYSKVELDQRNARAASGLYPQGSVKMI